MDLIKYFKKWEKYFKKISKEYKSKIDSMIKYLPKDDTDTDRYVLEQYEDKILKYSDYLYDISYDRDVILDELLKIDYLNYLKF